MICSKIILPGKPCPQGIRGLIGRQASTARSPKTCNEGDKAMVMLEPQTSNSTCSSLKQYLEPILHAKSGYVRCAENRMQTFHVTRVKTLFRLAVVALSMFSRRICNTLHVHTSMFRLSYLFSFQCLSTAPSLSPFLTSTFYPG